MPERTSSYRHALLTQFAVLLLVVSVSALFMRVYTVYFNLSPAIVLHHALLVATLWLLLLESAQFAWHAWGHRHQRSFRIALACAAWLTLSVQSLLYAADWCAMHFMGSTLTLNLISAYVAQLHLVWELSPAPIPTLIACLATHQAICACAAWGMSLVVSRGLLAASPATPRIPQSLRLRRPAASRVAVFSLLAFNVVYLASSLAFSRQSWAGEPIVGLYVDPAVFTSASSSSEPSPEEYKRVRATYPRDVDFEKRNVIFIFIDDLRPDHMSLYGYSRKTTPFLDSLERSGHLHKVKTTLASAPGTVCSVMSLMASRTLPKLSPDTLILPDLLYDQGYSVNYIVSGCWSGFGMDAVFGRGHHLFIDSGRSQKFALGDDRMLFEQLPRLPDRSTHPAFLFLSFLSPHMSAFRFPEYEVYKPASNLLRVSGKSSVSRDLAAYLEQEPEFIEESVKSGQERLAKGLRALAQIKEPRDLSPANHDAYVNFYDNGIVQTDAFLEKVFQILRAKGYLENALVVIFSDHGEGMGEHREYSHCGSLYNEFLSVPLIFYEERPAYYANLEFASLMDIFPTVLDRLQLPIPRTCEGRSLLHPESDRDLYHYSTRAGSLWTWAVTRRAGGAACKYIVTRRDDELLEAAFDLSLDPNEQRNAIFDGPFVPVHDMRSSLRLQRAKWNF